MAVASRSVIHVHWTYPPTTGGVESHLWDLTRLQADRGWQVTVLTGEKRPNVRADCEIISTPLLDLEQARSLARTPDAHTAQLTAYFRDIVEATNASVIHGHNLHHFSPAPALAIETLRSQRRLSAHHTFHETWPDVLAESPVYRRWDGNYAISKYIQEQCEDLIGYRPDLLSPGVDTNHFCPTREAFSGASTPVIFHPARLLPWKGVHVSIAAMAILLRKGSVARLVLTDTQRIADWDGALPAYREKVIQLIDQLDLRSSVTFVTAAFTDMPALYNAADIVLYPTVKSEPFGLVPPEGMSCARPVIAAACGGIVETVKHGVTGFLVRPDDPADLAAHIQILLNDPRKAREMGAAGRSHVLRHFSADAYVDELDRRYQAFLN